jgi:plastocyanin
MRALIILSIIALFILSACTITYNPDTDIKEGEPSAPPEQPGEVEAIENIDRTTPTAKATTIEITSKGFSPDPLTVRFGDTVTFVNKQDRKAWPASDHHPTHTVYPGSGIEKCKTDTKEFIFDACKGLLQDETYSFTFNSAGTWNYHDHLNPRRDGTIFVEG